MKKNNWAIIGLGFISQRHIQAIQDVGDNLICACDIDETKQQKLLSNVRFFKNYKKMIKDPIFHQVDWVAICTPNYLHYEMIKKCLIMGKNVLCEKPLVLNTKHIKELKKIINLQSQKLYTVLQLRHNPELQELKKIQFINANSYLNVHLHRGQFYWDSWKGNKKQSGNLLFNIGIHYLDLLVWLFGNALTQSIMVKNEKTVIGDIYFGNKNKVHFNISLTAPMDNQIRQLIIDDQKIDLTRHFENLHTKIYEDIKQSRGVDLSDVLKTTKLIEKL